MNLTDFKEDLEKREAGSPCYIGDGCFYIKRTQTAQYFKEIEDIKRRLYGFSEKIDHNELLAHWLVEHGVTDWSGIFDEDDAELEYSKQAARKVFLNPAYFLGLNAILINHGNDYSNYLFDAVNEDIEAVKKN